MIDREVYIQLANFANTKFENMRSSLSQDFDVVFVASADVYAAMLVYDSNPLNDVNDVIGTYRGVRLGVINEGDATEFFQPVIYSREYRHYSEIVEPGDFVVFKDEDDDRVFRLASICNAVMYEDTGYTVNFDTHLPFVRDNAVENTINNVIDNTAANNDACLRAATYGVFPDDNGTVIFEAPVMSATLSSNNTYINEETLKQLTYINEETLKQLTGYNDFKPVRKRKRAEKELDPGDTKLLDDFLSDFQRKEPKEF